MSSKDPKTWLEEQVRELQQQAPTPPPRQVPHVADYATPLRLQSPPPASAHLPLLAAAAIFGICLIVAALILRGGSDDRDPDDPRPEPIDIAVVEAFDDMGRTFFLGLGGDIESIGQRVQSGEIATVDAWVSATRDAFTKHDDAFIKATGEWDNKHVPQVPEPANEFGESVVQNRQLTPAERSKLASYTIASGKGLKQAVSK